MVVYAVPGIVTDIPNAVERGLEQIEYYLSGAIAFLGHAALTHPNEFVTAVSTIFIAIFTTVLAVKTSGLFKETAGLREETAVLAKFAKQQADDMKDSIAAAQKSANAALLNAETSKAAIRAVMAINRYTVIRNFSGGQKVASYSFTPNIDNIGNSHAVDVTLVTYATLVAPDQEAIFNPPPPEQRGESIPVGPGMKLAAHMNPTLSVADMTRVWRRERRFVLCTRVDYKDIFGDPHHVESWVEVEVRHDPAVLLPEGDLEHAIVFSPTGNRNSMS
jgi:hypothetical protein